MPCPRRTMLPTECLSHILLGTPSHWTRCPSKHSLRCSWIDPQSLSMKLWKRRATGRTRSGPKSEHANDAMHPPWVQTQCAHSACSETPRACRTASHPHASLEPEARPGLATRGRCCTPPATRHRTSQHRILRCSMGPASSARQTWTCPCPKPTCSDPTAPQA